MSKNLFVDAVGWSYHVALSTFLLHHKNIHVVPRRSKFQHHYTIDHIHILNAFHWDFALIYMRHYTHKMLAAIMKKIANMYVYNKSITRILQIFWMNIFLRNCITFSRTFLRKEFTCLKATKPLWDKLILTAKPPGILGTHFIHLWNMKGWVSRRATWRTSALWTGPLYWEFNTLTTRLLLLIAALLLQNC